MVVGVVISPQRGQHFFFHSSFVSGALHLGHKYDKNAIAISDAPQKSGPMNAQARLRFFRRAKYPRGRAKTIYRNRKTISWSILFLP